MGIVPKREPALPTMSSLNAFVHTPQVYLRPKGRVPRLIHDLLSSPLGPEECEAAVFVFGKWGGRPTPERLRGRENGPPQTNPRGFRGPTPKPPGGPAVSRRPPLGGNRPRRSFARTSYPPATAMGAR